MEFEINKDLFLKSIQKVQAVVERKNALPLLSNVRIKIESGNMEINATDLEVGIRDRVEVKVKESGSITVSAKKLYEVLKELSDDNVLFRVDDNNWILIDCGPSSFKLVGMSDEDFPRLPDFDESKLIPVSSDILDVLTSKTLFAVSHDENRRILNGVKLVVTEKEVKMVATDGHRLAYVESKNVSKIPNQEIIIPQKGINEMRRMISSGVEELQFSLTESNVLFKVENEVVMIRMVDGTFPDYTKVIPESTESEIRVKRENLYNSLKRVSLFSDIKVKGVKFEISKNLLKVTASTPEYGEAEDEIQIEYNGEPIVIGFNVTYVLELLRTIDSEDVIIRMGGGSNPVIFEPSEIDDYKYFSVIMPMII